MFHRWRFLILPVLMAVLAAGCSPAGEATGEPAPVESPVVVPGSADLPSPDPTAEPTLTDPPSPSPPSETGATVEVAELPIGRILVDGAGATLYAFTMDTAGVSTCYDDCAAAWPPLLVDGDVTVGTGLDAADFSTVERDDGTKQVRIGEWPLYYFEADSVPGDVTGQGVGDVWFVVGSEGELIRP